MFFFKKLQRYSFCSHFLEQNDQKLSTISTFCGFVKKYPKPSCSFVGFDYLCQSKGRYKGDRHQPQFNNHLIMKAIRTFLFLAISAVLICCANTSAKKTDATAENAGAPSVSASVAENTPTDVRGLGLVGNVKEVSVTVREISPEPGEPYVDSTQVMRFDEKGRVLKDRYDNLYKYDDKGNFIFGLSEKTKMRRDEKGRIVYYENRQDEEDDLGFHINFEYDDNGRMSKAKMQGWESTVDEAFTYTGDNIYPDRFNAESEDEGDHYSLVVDYTYKKFDDKGNWTEREVHSVSKHTVVDEDTEETYETKSLEQRVIQYY